ncbi:MAG: hypothetical protein KatS3mg068_2436 [Candidatus Sericytochromatia bacterium]|nr:MAG: hypothetical protein KatS3mg068_2436 [Candidatus Sericytochromatia bacterium]
MKISDTAPGFSYRKKTVFKYLINLKHIFNSIPYTYFKIKIFLFPKNLSRKIKYIKVVLVYSNSNF